MNNTYYHVCWICHKPAWIFTCTHRFLLAEMAWQDLFPHWGFIIFCTPGLIGFFYSWRFYFSAKPTWFSNRGGKWHRPRILRAWNRWSGPGIEPGTHKKIVLQGQGFEPWTYKKRSRARSGVRTLDQLKRSSYDRARDREIRSRKRSLMWSRVRS